ncbi:MAG: hypothetical protein ACLS5Y_02310 [Clostridia bacterium]
MNTKGYKMLFKDSMTEEDKYWLGSSYCDADLHYINWGMYYVYAAGSVYGHNMYNSFGYVCTPSYGIRPVVTLKSDIQLQSASAENGITTYNIKNKQMENE